MRRSLATFAACAILVGAIAACGGTKAPEATPYGIVSPTPSPSPSASIATAETARPTPTPPPHVFIVLMENTGPGRAFQSQAIARLAAENVFVANYRAVARPSLPNYLALTSGSTWGVADNSYHVLPAEDLGTQLTTAGISWRAYMEGMTAQGGCMSSPYPYALKHNPFAYYGGKCPPNVVPIELFDADLAGNTPNFVWITADLCHSGHDCAVNVAGAWLEGLVSRIVSSAAWRTDGVLFIAWDEGDGGDESNFAPLIVITKNAKGIRIESEYDHYSLLATIQDLFRVARLGDARTARPIALPLAEGR